MKLNYFWLVGAAMLSLLLVAKFRADFMRVRCGRCRKKIKQEHAETCWFCLEYLCYECWDEFGHCGHEEADEINQKLREKGSR